MHGGVDLSQNLSGPIVKQLLRACLGELGSIEFTSHALKEMADDDMTTVDVVNVLRGGWMDGCGQYDADHCCWRYRICTHKFFVVVAFEEQSDVIIVTAWKLKRKR